MYLVTKTYGHELGLSACFRQWRAKSHCRFLHGYPLSFKFTFAADRLDENNWVIDFGGLKDVKAWLAATFDHKLLVAEDDPASERFKALAGDEWYDPTEQSHVSDLDPVADILVIPFVGCEGFAKYAHDYVSGWLGDKTVLDGDNRNLRLVCVEVREHGGNSAIYRTEA